MLNYQQIIAVALLASAPVSYGAKPKPAPTPTATPTPAAPAQPAPVAADAEALMEGNLPIDLGSARLQEIAEFFKNSRASLEKLRKEAKGFDIHEANTRYTELLQKIVQESYRLQDGAHAEFLMRVALNQGLALTSAYYVPDAKGQPVLKPGLLKKASNPLMKRVILEDSIALAIKYFQEADQVATEKGEQNYDQFGQFAAERLARASTWVDLVLEEGYRAKFLKKILEQWLQVVLVDENLKDSKFGNEELLISQAFEKLALYPNDLGAQERILREALRSVVESLRSNKAVKPELLAPATRGGGSGYSSGSTAGPIQSMAFVSLSGGTFKMGCVENTDSCYSDEKPVHSVTLSPFEIMTTEVTQGMWTDVMGSNPSSFSDCGGNCPVENVSWNDVQDFIAKLNERNDGYFYRLPTEAEWEFAARANTTTEYHTGNGEAALQKAGWYSGNSGSKTHPVAQKQANAFGIYDMHGNVWEWVLDWYDSGYYTNSPKENPSGASGGSGRVLRGGSWYNGAGAARSAYRGYDGPGSRWYDSGFRLARTPK